MYINDFLSQDSINNFIEYKFYKDTDIEILKSNFNKINSFYLFLFDDTLDGDNKTIWKCKYYYSMEDIEAPTCPKGYEFNPKYKICDVKKEPIIEETEDNNLDDDMKIPELKNLLYLFIQIIVIIIILYIIYIFYDIFSEVIKNIFNGIYVMINKIRYDYYPSYIPEGNTEYEQEINKMENKKKLLEIELDNIKNKKLYLNDFEAKP